MQNKKYRIILLFSGLFLLWNMQAQIGTWKMYMAYNKATIVVETPNYIFGVYDGSLLSYSPEDKEIRTYSKIQGLNDTDIKFMAYHAGERALILVYSNSNVDIFLGENDVHNISFIKNNSYIQDKTVHNLEIIGEFAYLSTEFGIVVIDVKNRVMDWYRFGPAVRSVCRKDNYLYAATSEGTKRGLITSNLKDNQYWETVEGNQTSIEQMVFFKDYRVVILWNMVFYFDENGWLNSFGLNVV